MVLTIILSIILSLFSTIVMSYIAVSTPLGPWIAPTLVLMGMALLRLFGKYAEVSDSIVCAVSAGSVGGILATACGFAFPTLYFLDAQLFDSWMSNPVWFASVVSALGLISGWLGICLANKFEHSLLVIHALPFPVGNMVYKVINARAKAVKAWDLFCGFWASIFICFLRTGIGSINSIIPKALILIPPLHFGVIQIPEVSLTLMPMFWAIGFVAGIGMVSSLAIGSIAKLLLIEPIHSLYFPAISGTEFTLAFCSGMIIAGVAYSFWGLVRNIKEKKVADFSFKNMFLGQLQTYWMIEFVIVLLIAMLFLSYFDFSLFAQLYLLFFAGVCAYQITLIAGKVGLAQLGRFATFVMVPGMFFFNFNYVQVVFIATFVQICGGVMTDILFGRKLAQLSGVSMQKVRWYQYFGLFISAMAVGLVFWLLFSHVQLGSSDLFAQRAQSRALLIRAQQFDLMALFVGLVFGGLLRFLPFSPMLVFGGILMPINLVLGFVGGALLTLLYRDPEEGIPFWSGVFAANSLWMVIRALYNHIF